MLGAWLQSREKTTKMKRRNEERRCRRRKHGEKGSSQAWVVVGLVEDDREHSGDLVRRRGERKGERG